MRFPVVRFALIAAAFASVFFFPYPYTLALSFAASVAFPPTGVLVGIVADFMYLASPSVPLATVLGLAASLVGLLVRRFVKARIMGA